MITVQKNKTTSSMKRTVIKYHALLENFHNDIRLRSTIINFYDNCNS